ncbi:hypothetical protein FB451DRAFT_1418806 [Mycena latifolia]|nr:hypothetical protein FB451DRAFT_1418806 [Mycena latifolia]
MAENLSDEILFKILSPGLKVAEKNSSSAVLVVNKAWLRISTLLLYNIGDLRSKAQAGALATTLERSNELGRFIKKLRVEGGFGKHMGVILRHTSNVTGPVSRMAHPPGYGF